MAEVGGEKDGVEQVAGRFWLEVFKLQDRSPFCHCCAAMCLLEFELTREGMFKKKRGDH